ncbi:uncharacterized protein LOC121249317 [Juglans microcarpa x Juglans regia]|uniref:uncharacterized protein LOC121249317 n=1 Tax=Juglans microcarpa x Juglans regia TaxID=2249226 RepID=UPI001B7E1552|nr:uncharacterized protein LOC121249317 [Juglans microcarpa x Juglans regia]
MDSKDKLIWGNTKKGQFTVSSAYQLEMSRKETVKGECSEGREWENRWRGIWNLNIPRKVKIFMWKAVKELLATRNNLYLRGIIEDQICPICKSDVETTMHAIWFCPAAANVWSKLINVIQKWSSNELDLLALWERLVEKVSTAELEEIVMVMRSIWLRRNELIFDGIFKSPSQVMELAREELRMFHLVQQNARQSSDTRTKCRDSLWRRKVGLGRVVIRDEEREILVAVGEQKRFVLDSTVAESYALWKALEVCRDLNFRKVLFEGDAQVIVNAGNEGKEDYSIYGSVIEDAKKLLKAREQGSVKFVYRKTNEAAHVLAKEAIL